MDWGPALAKLRCPVCHSGFQAEDVTPIREFDRELYVRCICMNCHSISAAVFVQHTKDDPVTDEDVIAVHEYLLTYFGDANGLFK